MYDMYNDNAGKEHLEELIREATEERRANQYLKAHPEKKIGNKVRQMLVKMLNSTIR